MLPMLATPAARPGTLPQSGSWCHEVKWDGMRVILSTRNGRPVLTSRTEKPVTAAYPELARLELPDDLVLDGEVVAFAAGRPSFATLQSRIHVRDPRRALELAAAHPVTYLVFDLLRLGGRDLTRQPLEERRRLLEQLNLPTQPAIQVPPTYEDGELLLAATKAQGLEGVVSKRLSSRYHPGLRSPDWIKNPHRTSLSCLVAGWSPQTGTTNTVGSLWMTLPDGQGGWAVLGRIGSGGKVTTMRRLRDLLTPLEQPHCPYDQLPTDTQVATTRWTRPELVIEVDYLEADADGRLRTPILRGIRDDLTAADLADQPTPHAAEGPDAVGAEAADAAPAPGPENGPRDTGDAEERP